MPINEQNPIFEQTTKIAAGNVSEFYDFVEYKFAFDETTFYLEGSGKTHYDVQLSNGDILPPWIVFLPSQYMFVGNPPQNSGSIDIKITASNDVVS